MSRLRWVLFHFFLLFLPLTFLLNNMWCSWLTNVHPNKWHTFQIWNNFNQIFNFRFIQFFIVFKSETQKCEKNQIGGSERLWLLWIKISRIFNDVFNLKLICFSLKFLEWKKFENGSEKSTNPFSHQKCCEKNIKKLQTTNWMNKNLLRFEDDYCRRRVIW